MKPTTNIECGDNGTCWHCEEAKPDYVTHWADGKAYFCCSNCRGGWTQEAPAHTEPMTDEQRLALALKQL